MPTPGQDPTPTHSNAFGAAEDSDATRQAQHTQSNDTPTDVNNNAALGRFQALTTGLAGAGFAASADRRASMFDVIATKMGLEAAESTP